MFLPMSIVVTVANFIARPELNAMGIEVRYLAFPRAGIPSGSRNCCAWCAEDNKIL